MNNLKEPNGSVLRIYIIQVSRNNIISFSTQFYLTIFIKNSVDLRKRYIAAFNL